MVPLSRMYSGNVLPLLLSYASLESTIVEPYLERS